MVGYRVGAGVLAVIDSKHACPAYTADNIYIYIYETTALF